MKKNNIIIAILAAAMASQGCSDEMDKKTYVPEGTEITFGVGLDAVPGSRTYYGPETTDGSARVWPIYWNYPDNLDRIFIYSPGACAGRNQASYEVNPEAPDQTTVAKLTRLGDFGIQTGTEETYDFYSIYPAAAVTGTANNGIINATLSAAQSVVFAGTEAARAQTVPDKPQVGSYNYLTTPDMSNCLMTASNTGVVIEADKPVNLSYSPFSSVIDITVPGPDDNNTVTGREDCAVTSVMIVADAPIAGDFSYDFTKPDLKSALSFGANARDSIEISTLGLDASGNMTGIPLANGNTLRLQAFLLPNPDVKDIKVKVYTSDAQVWTKTLNVTDFQPRQIHKVNLPRIKFAEAEFDYSRWLSQLDPRIYLSEISLPGSTSSFSWKLNGTEYASSAMQTLEVAEQFRAGARVFRCHVWLYDMPGADGKSPAFGINVNGETYVRPLGEVIEELHSLMAKAHSDEFCVLMISDFAQSNKSSYPSSTSSNAWNSDNYKTFYDRFNTLSQVWKANGWVPDNIDANTTIGDVKGKIIVKLQLNGNGNENSATSTNLGGTTSTDQTNSLLEKIVGWQDVNGCDALLNWWTAMNGNKIFYAPMAYGNVGTYSVTTKFANYVAWPPTQQVKGAISVSSAGIGSQAADMVTESANYTLAQWRYANCSVTNVPDDFDDPNKLWYIYGAQASPGSSTAYNNAKAMIGDVVDAIKNNYKTGGQTLHNKFFMTYLGGASSSYSKNTITNDFVPQWNSLTTSANFGDNRPFGWVLFNEIPNADTEYAQLSAEGKLVRDGIAKVISRNNDIAFKLQRKKEATTAKTAPAGDVKGASKGGSIF